MWEPGGPHREERKPSGMVSCPGAFHGNFRVPPHLCVVCLSRESILTTQTDPSYQKAALTHGRSIDYQRHLTTTIKITLLLCLCCAAVRLATRYLTRHGLLTPPTSRDRLAEPTKWESGVPPPPVPVLSSSPVRVVGVRLRLLDQADELHHGGALVRLLHQLDHPPADRQLRVHLPPPQPPPRCASKGTASCTGADGPSISRPGWLAAPPYPPSLPALAAWSSSSSWVLTCDSTSM